MTIICACTADRSWHVRRYPASYIKNGNNWSHPVPESMDEFMTAAAAAGVTPIILFEYYAPQFLNQSGFGSYDQWFGIGAAFAKHLGPHGTWATSPAAVAAGVPPGFGVTWYTAINEPDLGDGFTKGEPGPAAYAAALAGLSAGVKSVLPDNGKVMPGGLASVNAYQDCTLRGLAAHLGPLWANGTLDGLDLHTYYDVQYAPMEDNFRHSAQANYDCVLAAAGEGFLLFHFIVVFLFSYFLIFLFSYFLSFYRHDGPMFHSLQLGTRSWWPRLPSIFRLISHSTRDFTRTHGHGFACRGHWQGHLVWHHRVQLQRKTCRGIGCSKRVPHRHLGSAHSVERGQCSTSSARVPVELVQLPNE
jgi:hypothetical protein